MSKETDSYGIKRYYDDKDNLHREDGPAVIYPNGSYLFYTHGLLDRKDGPAIHFVGRYDAYYVSGKHHRQEGPAVEYTDGRKEWWIEDRLVQRGIGETILERWKDGKLLKGTK